MASTAPPVEPATAISEPIVEKPVAEQPTVEKPVAEQPVLEKPVPEKPAAVEQPVPEKPATAGEPLIKVKTAIASEETETGKKIVPFLHPEPGCAPTPPAALTPEQQAKYDEILDHVRSITTLPVSSAAGAETRELEADERMWLSKECLLRYLRASKWDVAAAKKRLGATLVWRREYGAGKFTADYVSPENETGKQVILGYDNEGRPCLYLNPGRQNTERTDRQVHHLVWALERITELMPPGQETLALLVDFNSRSSSHRPPISQATEVLRILQGHYPERLGRALVINIPFVVWGFFKILNPFIDPMTREKLKFNENLRDHVPPVQLDKIFGGDCNFEYDHAKYWPELVRITDELRATYKKRWEEGGCQIGASEFELKGGHPAAPAIETGLEEKVQNLDLKN